MKILIDYQITTQYSDHGSGKTLIGPLGCIHLSFRNIFQSNAMHTCAAIEYSTCTRT